jgi:F-type H+-transporting ATPase subunit a
MNADTLHSSPTDHSPHSTEHKEGSVEGSATTAVHGDTSHVAAQAIGHVNGHDEHGSHEIAPGEVFTHLLGELGDHHALVLFEHVVDLPVILLDNGTLHTYANATAMEVAGAYTMQKGHPVRTADKTAPTLDLSITNYVVFEWIALLILCVVGMIASGKYKKNPTQAPKGVQNMLEAVVVYLRDEVIYPNIKPRKTADRLLPYFLTIFFFILLMNLLGLIPGGHTATSAIGVTAGLAITAFLVINWTAIRESGIGAWFKHLLGGGPLLLAPIMVPIEIISLFVKPFALTMRLFANMTAGHVVLLAFVGLIFFFKSIFVAPASIAFSVFVYCLELLAAFLQAYVFTMLTAVFTGMAIGEHSHDGGHH